MKVSLTFNVDKDQRKAFAWYIDKKNWDGKRKATRDEIEGCLRDGAEESFEMIVFDFEQHFGEI